MCLIFSSRYIIGTYYLFNIDLNLKYYICDSYDPYNFSTSVNISKNNKVISSSYFIDFL